MRKTGARSGLAYVSTLSDLSTGLTTSRATRLGPYTFHTNPDRFPNIRNPSAPQVNIAIEKSFPFSERYKLTFRGEAFNVGNTVIRAAPDTNFNDANFGQLPLAQQNFARLVQPAAKFYS